ncbi:hypothetical protein WJX73_006612 [Symbiochloris irregularis]|uniref:UspA domain-containing protein n=1 Tax=Symbiochloris irregularis TaxID=706552 RepID=A0AAW1NQK5_9CHLO
MAFAAALNQRLVVGIGLQGKAAEKTVRFTVENLVQPGDEIVLVHVNVINPNYAATSASHVKQLKHMVAKRLAPVLDEHCVSFRVHTVHVTMPVFTSANPSSLVGDVLCTKAAEMHAAGVVSASGVGAQ